MQQNALLLRNLIHNTSFQNPFPTKIAMDSPVCVSRNNQYESESVWTILETFWSYWASKKIRERQEPLSNIYFGKNVSYGQSTDEARTAKLLRTEMSTLRDDKMRPLFQEAIVTNLVVTHSTTRYQMKAMDIIFPMIPVESLWVKWFRHLSPAKLGIFSK